MLLQAQSITKKFLPQTIIKQQVKVFINLLIMNLKKILILLNIIVFLQISVITDQ